MKERSIVGIAKVIKIDDIDTDQIFHQSLLTIHDPEEIKSYIFGNLKGYENFGKENHEGEILIVGKNFGKGSTRQQAVTGFLAHKFKAIIGESFGPIYYSNAVNAGLFLVEAKDISKLNIKDGDEIEILITDSQIINKSRGTSIQCSNIPQPVLDIIDAGGLLKLGEKF